MRWPWRRSTPPLTVATLIAEVLARLGPQVTAVTTALPPAVVAQTWTPVLHRWTACVWDLPASAAHHHHQPFGLLTHSLEVAAHALTAFTHSSAWWAQVPDPAQRHHAEGAWRLGTALAGLLHDAGKLFDVTVTVPGVATPWDPLAQPLLPWLLAQPPHGALPPSTVTWQPGRGIQHTTAGALAATLVLTRADLVALTLPVARTLWTSLSGVPDPTNLFAQLLRHPVAPGGRGADGQSVQAALAAQPLPPSTLAAQVVTTLAQCCQEGVLRLNQVPGQVFVQADATLVVVPAALDAVRQRLAATGIRLPGNTVVFDDLAAAGYVLGPAGQNVQKAVVARPGKPPVTLAVLRLPHALLWGPTPPPPYAGSLTWAPLDPAAPTPS